MPTYGYQCKSCEHKFEVFQKITDPAVTECESCGGPVKKLLYPVGIQFKGSGFYVNDYANAKSAPASETAAEAKPETKTETPAPTAPAAPAATSAPATPSTTTTT